MRYSLPGRPIDRTVNSLLQKAAARRVALLGGTTTFADCLVALRYLVDPRHMMRGEAIAEYEQAFARQVGVHYAYSFCHGRVGLYGILCGLGIGPGDEVLLQVPTHIVVPNAIRYTGAKPVYVDCQLNTYNMDLKEAEQRITSRTRAFVLQHTFGIPVDLDAALDLTRRYKLDLIEDCVHALGATYDGRQVGGFGRAAFFSTEETKTISTTMGGMAVTDDPELADYLRVFQQNCAFPSVWKVTGYLLKLVLYHCLTEPHLHHYIRTIYELLGRPRPLPEATSDEEAHGKRPVDYEVRLSNAQAALGLRQLRRLDANLAHRRKIAQAYGSRLSMQGFDVPCSPAKAESTFLRYPVWVADRDAALRAAAQHAVLGLLRLLLARHYEAGRGRLLGGILLLVHGQTVYYAFSGWRREDQALRPNDALHWQAIQDACAEGFRCYDFGEVDRDDRGLAEFKSKWGAQPHWLYRYYYPAPREVAISILESDSRVHRLARVAWQHLPTKATALLSRLAHHYL